MRRLLIMTALLASMSCASSGSISEMRMFIQSRSEVWQAAVVAMHDIDAKIVVSNQSAGVLAGDIAFAYFSDTDDTDTIASVKCTAGVVTITENADPVTDHSYFYVVLRARGTFKPSHYVAYAGQHTCAGGDAVEAATVTGLLATDIIISVIGDATCSAANILKVVPTANTITWTFNADPTVGHAITYAALRAY